MNTDYDVAIVGGGLVGASLALALSGHGLKIAVLERSNFRQAAPPGYDDRTLALSLASQNIFRAIGLWQQLGDGLTPIRQVHVSQLGLPGTVQIRAADYDLAALGHVVEARAIGQAVMHRLPAATDIDLIVPATLTAIEQNESSATITCDHDGQTRRMSARVLVGADGTGSAVRRLTSIAVRQEDYRQVAIIANVTPAEDHCGRAYERLTETGPLAMLPHVNGRCGSVWVTGQAQADGLLALSDDEYMDRLQQRFGYRLGRFARIGTRASYPLSQVYAPQPVKGRCVLIGNAGHTIHPVAAQGFNLGLRDVATLTELVVAASAADQDPGCPQLLARYWQWRQTDVEHTIEFTDNLVRLFAQPLPLVKFLRSGAMIAMQLLPQVRHALAQRTMGFGGRVPQMARGGFR